MYPISDEADFDPTPNRWTAFFRLLLLTIPWLVVAYSWLLVGAFTLLIVSYATEAAEGTRPVAA